MGKCINFFPLKILNSIVVFKYNILVRVTLLSVLSYKTFLLSSKQISDIYRHAIDRIIGEI